MDWITESGQMSCIISVPESEGTAGWRIVLDNIRLSDFVDADTPRPHDNPRTVGWFVIRKAKTITNFYRGMQTGVKPDDFEGRPGIVDQLETVARREFGQLFDAKVRADTMVRVARATNRLPSEIVGSLTLLDAYCFAADLLAVDAE